MKLKKKEKERKEKEKGKIEDRTRVITIRCKITELQSTCLIYQLKQVCQHRYPSDPEYVKGADVTLRRFFSFWTEFCAENWKLSLDSYSSKFSIFPTYVFIKKNLDKRWSSSFAGRASILSFVIPGKDCSDHFALSVCL